jgi:tRNA 2-thiouridine synthesizing protein A
LQEVRLDTLVVDGGDKACGELLIELRARLRQVPAGTVVHLIATDPAAPIDLAAWCHLTGHAYLGTVSLQGENRPVYGLQASRHPADTQPSSPWRLA